DGVEAGMKCGVRFNRFENANGGGKEAVYRPAQVVGGDRILKGECGYLRFGVNARVGPAGPGDMDRFALDTADDVFQNALNGGKPGLHLPAVKLGAIVGEGDADSSGHALAPAYEGREPGFTTGSPAWHIGHLSGSCATTCRVSRAARGI